MRRIFGGLCALLAVTAWAAPADEALRADIEAVYEAPLAASFVVAVDASDENLVCQLDVERNHAHVRYRMNFNQVAEGWSWQPLANPAQTDYYRYKFLPLGSREREQGARYLHEDLPGRVREVKRLWRYDYFFAFDNPYDFYPRPDDDDDAGFDAEFPAPKGLTPAHVAMLAWGSREAPGKAESTTFWKATDGKPVDLTLKNRYLIGRLSEIWFVDKRDGSVLAKLAPRVPPN